MTRSIKWRFKAKRRSHLRYQWRWLKEQLGLEHDPGAEDDVFPLPEIHPKVLYYKDLAMSRLSSKFNLSEDHFFKNTEEKTKKSTESKEEVKETEKENTKPNTNNSTEEEISEISSKK